MVGIGASAGGLRALKQFFATVPPDTGLPFVVVVHLPPDRESHLAELLQPAAAIPVRQVTKTTVLEPDQVYVIPPGYNLTAVDSHLRLTPIESQRIGRAPIDHLFRTLAKTQDGSTVAVILSGTGTDGADGVRRVRAAGGLVLVQDPSEAEYDGMPRSAIDTGAADVVAPVGDLLTHIVSFTGTRPRLAGVEQPGADESHDLMQNVLALVRLRTGHDFLRYKRSTVGRRVVRRMQILGVEQLADYLELLRGSPREASALLDDLLINVTGFFRDPAVFGWLGQHVVPRLFDGKGPNDRIRVWSVGCATGEEAYSIGMLLLDEAARRPIRPQLQIFASDLHDRSLRYAREGFYPAAIEQDVPPERLERYFRREDGGYRITKDLRDTIVFAVHNLLQDPPFSHVDLILCRNLLIYLQPEAQRDVIELLDYALQPTGYLLLGTAETLGSSDLFRLENKKHHLYRRQEGRRGELRLPAFMPATAVAVAEPARAPARPATLEGYGGVHQAVVERFAPPSLLLNADHQVVHLSEHAGRYLRHPGGLPTTNVFKLVREELSVELRTALHAAKDRPAGAAGYRSRPVTVPIDGDVRQVVLRVSPVTDGAHEGLTLVIFDESDDQRDTAPREAAPEDEAVRALEAEMALSRSRLQTVIEEFETSQEEMRASNEELQSANEELRSTMEELETSREELQSINEELQTLNQENKHKVEELSQLSNDLQNLLQATDVATLFLDRELRILRFTPRVAEIFNVRPADRGRPLAHLTHRLSYGGLIDDARRVLQELVPVEREVSSEDGLSQYALRVTPYRTLDNRIEGTVITMVDITAFRQSVMAQRLVEARFRAIANLVPDLLWESGPDGSAVWFNDRWYAYTGQTVLEAEDFGWLTAVHPDDRDIRAAYQTVHSVRPIERDVRIRSAEGQFRWFQLRAEPQYDGAGAVERWWVAASDVHERRRALAEVERRVAQGTEALDQATAALSRSAATDRFRLALFESLRPGPAAPAGAAVLLARQLGAVRADYIELEQPTWSDAADREPDPGGESPSGPPSLPPTPPNLGPWEPLWGELQGEQPVVLADTTTDARLDGPARAQLKQAGIGAAILAPVVRHERLMAVLAVRESAPREWDLDEVSLVQETAERIANSVERSRTEGERNTLRRQLAQAEEEERRRLALELHDQLGQHLTAFALGVSEIRRSLPEESPAQSKLAQLEELARGMTRDAGDLALELRPPGLDDVGLPGALDNYLQQWSRRYEVEVELAATGLDGVQLPAEVATALFRIVQEALTNTARHAGASRVSVVLEGGPDSVRLVIEDNGQGFATDTADAQARLEGRFGLAGMRERATMLGGTVSLESAPGKGATIYVRVPLVPPAPPAPDRTRARKGPR